MNTKMSDYRNTTFLFVGLGCLIQLVGHIILSLPKYNGRYGLASLGYRFPAVEWTSAIMSLAVPVFCIWIGGLLRSIWPRPQNWVKVALLILIPLLYLRLVIWPGGGIDLSWPGYDILMLSLVIMGFLILPIAKSFKGMGWIASVLFLASAFCYVGVVRVSDHFSMVNFTLRESEWSVLFFRLMKVIPLAMSMFFLMVFSFSEACGKVVGRKWVQIVVIVLAVLTGIMIYINGLNHIRFTLRYLLVNPLTVYLVYVVVRSIKRWRTGGTWKEVFML